MSSPKFRLAPLFLLLLATCTDSPTAPSPQPLKVSRNLVAGEELKPRFLFLPPLGPQVRLDGAFDGSLQPVVEICQWSSGSCVGATVARFTTAPGPDQIRVFGTHQGEDGKGNAQGGNDGEGTNNQYHGNEGQGGGNGHDADNDHDASNRFYGVDWNTSHSTIVVGKIYRLRALLGDMELGYVDVQFSTNGSGNDDDKGNRNDGASSSAAGVITAGKDRTLPIKFWIEKPLQRITVVLGRGVTGSPAALDSMFRFGSTLSYNFQAMDGFENVQVSLDGRLVSRFGRVVADTTHVLYATVDRIVTLTPELQPLYEMARGTLSAADPVAATQAYLDRASEYARTHDAETALLQLGDLNYLAFDQFRDSAAVRRLDAALANHVFQIGGGSAVPPASPVVLTPSPFLTIGALRSAFSVGVGASDSLERTDLVYINGIWTTLGQQFTTLTEIETLRPELFRFQDTRLFVIKAFHNRTWTEQIPHQARCLRAFLAGHALKVNGENSAAGYMALCMADETYRGWAALDVIETIRQTLSILTGLDAPEADALALADSIQKWRDDGSHVILLPHSQGNLMAIQAIHHLRSVTEQYLPTRDSTCIGVVSLASPLSVRWELPDHYLAHVVVRNDPVPNLIPGANGWPRIDTDSSPLTFLERRGWPALRLHYMASSYLTAQARDSVKAGINEVYDACAIDHIDVEPVSATLRPGESKQLSPSLINKYGDTLAGRLVKWTSSNGASVIVSTTGLIGGAAPGISLVFATNHSASMVVPVTVLQPPLEIFPSTYTSPVPAGFWGNSQCDDAGGIPTPATTFYLKFFQGRAVMLKDFDGSQHVIDQIYEELFFPSGVAIRGGDERFTLHWNADRTQLSGTVIHSRFNCPGGWTFENSDAVTFTRSGS